MLKQMIFYGPHWAEEKIIVIQQRKQNIHFFKNAPAWVAADLENSLKNKQAVALITLEGHHLLLHRQGKQAGN